MEVITLDIQINAVLETFIVSESVEVVNAVCLPASYEVIDQNENILASGSIPSGLFSPISVVVPQDLTITTRVLTGQDFAEWTATADEVGTITNITTGVSGLVVKINTVVETVPFSISLNDVVRFEFTTLVANNTIKLEGSY